MGGGSLLSADFIEAAGPSVVGFRIGYPDLSPDAMGKDYPKFVEEYKKAYGEAPISGYHANAYDGAMLAIKAIEKVAKTDKDGNLYIGKKALRDAVFATKFDGISGPIACDAYGECSQFKPSVLRVHLGRSEDLRHRQEPEEDLAVGVRRRPLPAGHGVQPWPVSMQSMSFCGRCASASCWWSSCGTIGTLIKDRYDAAQWFDFVMFGLTIGSIYAQIALGYTMVYGVLRLINFAHGDIVMTGAFAGYFVATPLDRSGFLESQPVLAMAAILAVAIVASTSHRGADRAHRLPAVPPRRRAGAADLRHRRVVLPRADVPRHVRLGGEVLSRAAMAARRVPGVRLQRAAHRRAGDRSRAGVHGRALS